MGETIIEAMGLCKRFGDFTAVRDASFTVETGEIFGFLGPNGAGKTTTINMLTGLAKPTAGAILIAGEDGIRHIKKVQQRIGIVPDESNLYEDMSGFDNLVFCASLYGMEKAQREARARQLLAQFGLAETGKRPFKAFSKGMKRKLTIAAGIIHAPRILFLDEPTTGIDVESARQIRKLIQDLNGQGTTIFLTTHYIEEAERLCHRVGFIVDGSVIRVDAIGSLMQDEDQAYRLDFTLESHQPALLEAMSQAFPNIQVSVLDPQRIRLLSPTRVELAPFIQFFEDAQIPVYEVKLVHPSLEDVFVRITGIEIARLKKEKEGQRK